MSSGENAWTPERLFQFFHTFVLIKREGPMFGLRFETRLIVFYNKYSVENNF